MRIISLVPSITETLLEAGLTVVGRTRFCEHPAALVKTIPVVGGTKDLSWERLKEAQADLLLLDKEENLPWMAAGAPCRVMIAHVTDLESAATFAEQLILEFPENQFLAKMAIRWRKVLAAPDRIWDWQNIPGASFSNISTEPRSLQFLIWKNPWMGASRNTFIGSVLKKLGAGNILLETSEKYPQLEEAQIKEAGVACLFSSEPFPFNEIPAWCAQGALVDGAAYSWFGIRTLRFLEKELGLHSGPSAD